MQRFLISISFLILALLPLCATAQETVVEPHQAAYIDSIGNKAKYSAMIEMPQAYLSGICILKSEEGQIKGCFFNEFGISALEFSYKPGDKSAKLINVIKMMNKWYIKRVLRKDLALVIDGLLKGEPTYHDEKYKIYYKFTLLNDATEE